MKNQEELNKGGIEALIDAIEKEHFSVADLERLCGQHPEHAQQLREVYKIWQTMGALPVPQPDQSMNDRFYQTLSNFETAGAQSEAAMRSARIRQIGAAAMKWAAIFVLGLGLGWVLKPSSATNTVTADAPLVEQTDYAILTGQSSASDRLQLIQMSKQRSKPDDVLIEALHQTLLNDPNVNVRLSAIETLLYFSNLPKAREALIHSIPFQKSPLIQVTLADIMIGLQEKRSIEELKKLIQSEDVNIDVKIQLRETVEALL